jgi:hypothetical protein
MSFSSLTEIALVVGAIASGVSIMKDGVPLVKKLGGFVRGLFKKKVFFAKKDQISISL